MHKLDALITPRGSLEMLSQYEVDKLLNTSKSGVYETFRNCSIAVLNCGSSVDDSKIVLDQYKDFDIRILQQERGIKLAVENAPASAFVDGEMIAGIREHLFAVLRDIVYTSTEIIDAGNFDLTHSADITNAVFHILRNAGLLKADKNPDTVVCWGGHAIDRDEYDYTKEVGYQLGLRGLNVCTGCGSGAMKGPMKGATIGHAKQRTRDGRYIGITEPGIIAAESPNPIVNDLVIMPDIEKRLEAFVRIGHGIIVFPGGVGTLEETLHLLGILLHPDNDELCLPLFFTGPPQSADYFAQIDEFIGATLGQSVKQLYTIILNDPARVAAEIKNGINQVREFRKAHHDAYYFNWLMKIEKDFQIPFEPNHENMAKLALNSDQPSHQLAANLRRAISGIVAGNVKTNGILAIEKNGPFELNGEQSIMRQLDRMLDAFVAQNRMKLPGPVYQPCYRIVA